MLTKTQVKVILMLLDDKGHPEWEIAECLEMRECNLNPILNELKKREIVFTGLRPSRRQHENKGMYGEKPYYLSRELNSFRSLIREIAETRRPYDTGYLLEIIDNSKYLKVLMEKSGKEINTIIKEELSTKTPYSDEFFTKVIEPELVEELFCNLERLVSSKA